MPLRYEAIVFGAQDPGRAARFWAGLLDRSVVDDPAGLTVPGTDGQLSLRFSLTDREPARPGAMHLHLTSTDLDDQGRQVDLALALGGLHLDVGQRPDEAHVVLADPEGNAFCVIEPGNAYLAGTGHLGELTCEGAHEVGAFWSKALLWPLVWDRDQETAIQSPRGGTKISWSGRPTAPPARGHHEHHLVAPAGFLSAEADRLTGLGARLLGADGADVWLADPDGVPVRLSAEVDGR